MSAIFVSETLTPLDLSFATAGRARGEPGLPLKFRSRDQDWKVAALVRERLSPRGGPVLP
jgi:hypothetical protein